jgi:hypothetical protein
MPSKAHRASRVPLCLLVHLIAKGCPVRRGLGEVLGYCAAVNSMFVQNQDDITDSSQCSGERAQLHSPESHGVHHPDLTFQDHRDLRRSFKFEW